MKTPTSLLRRHSRFQRTVLLTLLPALSMVSSPVRSNPAGGLVVNGNASIGDGLGGHLSINQLSDKAIINWQDFSIGAGETTQFIQPGANSAVLNRVVTGNPSSLLGALRANGKVMVINPNGILVGATGTVDVGGLVLSTLDVSDADFLGGGDMVFSGNSESGIVNYGRINAVGGDVFLVGKNVTNTGAITAANGTVGLAAGREVLITASPNADGERVFVRTTSGATGGTGVENSGTIEGASVELKAHGNMFALAINNKGSLRATGTVSRGGKVFLRAPGGRVDNSGSIQATLPGGNGGRILLQGSIVNAGGTIKADGVGNGKGGQIDLQGEEINVLAGAKVTANGSSGGTINVGQAGETRSVNVAAGSVVSANGSTGAGGTVSLQGTDINIAGGALLSADGASGGSLQVGTAGSTRSVTIGSGATLSAKGGSGTGGSVLVAGDTLTSESLSMADASGPTGGQVRFNAAQSAAINGQINAIGSLKNGGAVAVSGNQSVTIGSTASLDASGALNGGSVQTYTGTAGVVALDGQLKASGAAGKGGLVVIKGGTGTNIGGDALIEADHATHGATVLIDTVNGVTNFGGTLHALGNGATAGRSATVKILGSEVNLLDTALVDVSGRAGGGDLFVGGGFQGRTLGVHNAQSTTVADGAILRSDALESGKGGNVIVWSNIGTIYEGAISATGVSKGGFAEISGKQDLAVSGSIDLSAASGVSGTLLLDPTNITISATGAAALGGATISNVWLSQQLDLGTNVVVSTNIAGAQAGNIVIGRTDSTANAAADRVEWYQENASTAGGTLSLLAQGNITFNTSVRSAGAGGINIVAGWDGTTGLVLGNFDISLVLATMNDGNALNDAAGKFNSVNGTNGSVLIGGSGTRVGLDVGSRFGDTNVAAFNLELKGSNTVTNGWAQLGFNDTGYEYQIGSTKNTLRNEWWGNGNGDALGVGATIFGNVRGKNYIADLGGTPIASPTGVFKGAGYGTNGNITVSASGRVDMRGGTQTNSYTQIGHGGSVARSIEGHRNNNEGDGLTITSKTTRDGFIIDPGDDRRSFFASSWRTNYLGDEARLKGNITVTAGQDVLVMASPAFETTAGYTDLVATNQTSNIYSMIGHGGYENQSSATGNITVTALGATGASDGRGLAGAGVQVRGGPGEGAFAMIGHGSGGEANRRSVWDQRLDGNITVTATTGAVRVLGYNQMPRTGNLNAGPLVGPTTALPGNSGADFPSVYGFVQIGHGGAFASAPTTGGIFTTPPSITVTSYQPDNSASGNISVTAGGTVSVSDNMGYDSAGNWTADPGPGTEPNPLSGGILRDVGVEVRSGNSQFGYSMIGHGGLNQRATSTGAVTSTGYIGNVSVEAQKGTVMFVGGEEKRSERTWGVGYNFTQLGHGGYDVDGVKQGNLTVSAGQGAGTLDGDIIFRSGRMLYSYAMIGHGGTFSNGLITGDSLSNINVTARDAIEFTSRLSGPSSYWLSSDFNDIYMGETGSPVAGNAEWAERVVGTLASGTQVPQNNSITELRFRTDQKFVQIGHGGNEVSDTGTFSLNNDIVVNAQTDSIRFTSGNNDRDFAHIGHGGYRVGGTPNIIGGDITVTAGMSAGAVRGDVYFDASLGGATMDERTTMLGIVNRDAGGNYLSLGQVNPVGRGFASFGMIGNGGYDFDGDHSGDITVKAHDNLYMIGPKSEVVGVESYVGGKIEGPSNFPASGTQNYWIGSVHTLTALQEATMMQRSFQLYHGNAGASEVAHKGNIVAGTLVLDIGGTGAVDIRDASNGDGTGTLYRSATVIAGNYAVGTHGLAYGTIDYATGKVTLNTSAITANNGNLEDGTANFQRNVTYSYTHPTLGTVAITSATPERTPESDMAIRPNESYVGNGRILAGSFSLVVDGDSSGGGRTVYQDFLADGNIRDSKDQIVGNIDYATGRVTIRRNINIAADEVVANYSYSKDNADSAFVQLGNGGLGSSAGGRDSAGHSGEIVVEVGGDIRFHGGTQQSAYAQLGHGGEGAQGRNGAQIDNANLSDPLAANYDKSGNITVKAGGIIEFLAGRGISIVDQRQYAQLGHGGRDSDGQHQGNITITAGTGIMSTAPGTIGGSGVQAGLVFTAGQTTDAYAQLGLGGADTVSARETGDTGRRGFSGDINVTTVGDIRFLAGTGGYSTNSVLGAATDWNNVRNYVQLGHGGISAGIRDNNGVTYGSGIGHHGDITVTSGMGSILFNGGDVLKGSPGVGYGILHTAQLGHGGFDANGEHYGNISVTAGKDITFTAGGIGLDENQDKYSWAQLGNGGDSADGNMGIRDAGNGEINTITVTAVTGDVNFIGGAGQRDYAQLGFGGHQARGDHRADITVSAGDDINFIGGQNPQPFRVVGDASSELDISTWQLGWVSTRNRNLTTTNVLVTTDWGTFTANTGTGLLIVASLTAAGTTAGLVLNQQVGEVNYVNGHVRFTTAISGGTIPVQFNNNGGAVEDNDPTSLVNTLNSRNSLLDAAAMSPGTFSAPNLIATFNNTRGGFSNVVEAIGARDNNVGIQAGSVSISVPAGGITNTVIVDDGAGKLTVQTAGTGSGLTAGDTVGTIDYTDGSIRFTAVVNPLGKAGVKADYTLDRVVGADRAYAQLGNGGYDADNGTAFTPGSAGNIVVTAAGDVRFHGGSGSTAYAQLGHGGDSNQGGNTGNITVTSGGIVEFLSGLGADLTDSRDYAQLGHGGYDADGNHSGNILVNAKSGLISTAPGDLTPGAVSEGIRFRAGRTDSAYVQMGHGGVGARSGNGNGVANAVGLTGTITAIANGTIEFTAGTLREDIQTDNNGNDYAQLGHGGYDADVTADSFDVTGLLPTGYGGVGHNGDIFVQSFLGSVNFNAGALTNGSEGTGMGIIHYSQLGHGGYATNGDHHGNITVLAGLATNGTVTNATSDIRFTGGGTGDNDADKRNYVQLGHGGWTSIGNMGVAADTILVGAARDIAFTAGADNDSYAQLGNGGRAARGDHSADLEVYAGRDINFTAGGGALAIVDEKTADFHQATNLGATTLGTGQGDAITALEGLNLQPGTLFVTIPGGPTIIDVQTSATTANLVVQSTVTVDMDGDGTAETTFTAGQVVGTLVYSTSTLTFNTDVNPDNRPTTITPSTPLVSARTSYQSREQGQSYAQLGHGGHDADNPNPGDNAASITMPDGNVYLFDGYGVGGPTAAQRVGNKGDIYVESYNGNINFIAGQAAEQYVQLGHGGMYNDGDMIGKITVIADKDHSTAGAAGNIVFDARGGEFVGPHNAQLGHGGYLASGAHTGDIVVDAGGEITFSGGRDISYAQIGHGGRNDHRINIGRVTNTGGDDIDTDANYNTAGVSNQSPPDDRRDFANDRYYSGTHTGDITVTSLKNITFTGYSSDPLLNNGGIGYVQIGHGGWRDAADPTSVNGDGHNGDITVKAGGLTMNASGQITAVENASAKITFEAGQQVFSSAQIGHGGFEAFGNHSGDIVVAAASGIDFHAHGATTDLAFTDANGNRSGRYSYLQIGHGGINAEYDPYLPRTLETRNTANPGADVALSAANGNTFNENPLTNLYFAQVVGGGTYLPGPLGVDGVPTYGQGSLMPLTTFYQPIVAASSVRFVDHDNNPLTALVPIVPPNRGQWFHINAPGAPIGVDGKPILGMSGNITVVTASGDVNLSSVDGTSRFGREEYVQIGHGGLYTGGDHTGNISVIAQDGNVGLKAGLATVNDGGYNSYAQIGHGGSWSGGSMIGNITVKALGAGHTVSGAAGSDNQNYVQIGHGGYDASYLSGAGTQFGTYDSNGGVGQSDTRNASVQGWHLQYWYNPGYVFRTEYTSAIANNALTFGAGVEFRRTIMGDITVQGAGGVTFNGGSTGGLTGNIAPGAYAQIGHGGRSTESDNTGNITVDGGTGAVTFTAGHSDQDYAQIGHGGYEGDGNHDGNITVNAGMTGATGVEVRAGDRPDAYAQVGHGGTNASSAARDATNPTVPLFKGNSGNITVNTAGNINFIAGTGSFLNSDEDSRNYVQLGHGGYNTDVHFITSVDVFDTGIGHHGDISVTSTAGRLFFGAGDANRLDNPSWGLGEGRFHYAQLGHGGYESRGEHYGSITVDVAKDITFLGGSTEDNDTDRVDYAMLGHGGWTARGNMGRADDVISVTAGDDIVFTAGNSQGSFVQLGNGGRDSRGDHKGDLIVDAGGSVIFSAVQGRHQIIGEEKNYDLTRATEFGTQTNDAIYDVEGSNIVPGTLVITIPNGPILKDDGKGNIYVAGGTLGAFNLNDVVGTIWYTNGVGTNGRITFTADVNPNNQASPAAAALVTMSYQSLENQGSYAQLGHGGYNSDQTDGGANTLGNTGDISVFAGGDVVFNGGVGAQGYAQLGHGGYITSGRNSGDITVGTAARRIGGAVILSGGQGEYFDAADAYVQIGHGGRSSTGTQSGNISIYSTTGQAAPYAGIGVQAKAGTRNNNYALIGHGGTSSRSGTGNGAAGMEGNSGDITIDTFGSVNLIGGVLSTGSGTLANSNDDGNLYAQIGHGGYDVDVSLDGVTANGNGIGHHGNISVVSRLGSVNVLGGDDKRAFLPSFAPTVGVYDGLTNNGFYRLAAEAGGRFHSAMIGHGGYEARGNHWGDIIVHAGYDATGVRTNPGTNSNVLIQGGGTFADNDVSQQFAQIGHGGRSSVGDQGRGTDTTSVMATGDVTLQAGDGVDNYVMIGNGGTNTRGDHSGTVNVYAEGNVNVLASQLSATPALGSGLRGGYVLTGTSDTESIDRAANLAGGGDFTIRAGLNRVVPGSVYFDIFNDLGVKIGTVADADGSGALKVVSDFTELVGGTQFTAGQQVGTINYASGGSPVVLFTQDINPGAETDPPNLLLRFEYAQTDRAYAMIGHGGYDADNPDGSTTLGNTGDINVTAKTGDIVLRGGTDDDASATIGHGGRSTKGSNTGNIEIDAGGNLDLISGSFARTYASIGHGGYDAEGNHVGDICIHVGEQVLLDSAQGAATQTWTQIGHGQYEAAGNQSGFITVVSGLSGANGGITLKGGNAGGNDQYAQIGHGGTVGSGNHTGNITVIDVGGGGLTLTGGLAANSYALVGHGDGASNSSGTRAGNIYVDVDGAITVTTPGPANSVGWIGHQSTNANEGITLGTANTTLFGTGFNASFNLTGMLNQALAAGITTIGNNSGNFTFDLPYTYSSTNALNVLATGDITFLSGLQNSGTGAVNIAAGWDGKTGGLGVDPTLCTPVAAPNFDFAAVIAACATATGVGNQGTVFIGTGTQAFAVAVGSLGGATNAMGHRVEINGSDSTANAYGQLGFHQTAASQTGAGAVNLHAHEGGLVINAGDSVGSYAQAGHGGLGSTANTQSGAITVEFCEAGSATFNGGAGLNSYALLGHGGNVGSNTKSGDITFSGSLVNVDLNGGSTTGTSAQIGHGGDNSDGAITSNILLSASGAVTLDGGAGQDSTARIGSGGRDSDGAKNGTTTVTGASVTLTGGNGSNAGTQIGAGGSLADGNLTGTTTVTTTTGDLRILAGTGTDSASQVGAGGIQASGTHNSATTVNAAGNVVLDSTNGGASASARIGLGGTAADGAFTGLVGVTAGGDITLTGGTTNTGTYAQIGLGGLNSDASKNGGTTVSATNISLASGAGANAYTQIGAGGTSGSGNITGPTSVTASGGTVSVIGGSGQDAYAQLGAGGTKATGTHSSSTTVSSDGAVTVTGGSGDNSYAAIGLGGMNLDGALAGVTTVTTDGAVSLTAGSNATSYAQIGLSGGFGGNGDKTGSVSVTGASVEVTGAAAFAQIGNGGVSGFGTKNGNVVVKATAGDVTVTGGDLNGYALIGHGGIKSGGVTIGAPSTVISVSATADVVLQGGSADVAFAQIGNGGTNNDAGTTEATVEVLAGGQVDVLGGSGPNSYAQIGNGGSGSDGTKQGTVLVDAGTDVNVTRGSGSSAYAKIGNGDQLFSAGGVGTATGNVSGDIQVSAGFDVRLTGGLIGHIDPTIVSSSIATGGDTYVAVSRLDPEAGGNGVIETDIDSVLSAGGGELRIYLPERLQSGPTSNLIALGTTLNGVAYAGPPDPLYRAPFEYAINLINPVDASVTVLDEHLNLDPQDTTNLAARTVNPDTALYSASSGFSLYYDTIEALYTAPETPPPAPPVVGGGSGGVVPPTEEAVVEVVEVGPFTEIDGQIGFTADYLFPGQPWIQVGPFVDALLDEWHQNEFNRDALDSFGPDGKTGWSEFATLGTSFNIRYRVIKDGGANSFNVFNNGMLGPFFLPINNGMSLELQIDETLNQTTEPGLEEELKESGNNSPAAGGSAAPAAGGEAPAPAAGAPLDPFGAGAAPEAPGPMPAAGAAPDPFGAPAPPAGAAPSLPAEADPFKS